MALVFMRQTIPDLLLPSDHLFHAVQILDAADVGKKSPGVREQIVSRMTAVWVTSGATV